MPNGSESFVVQLFLAISQDHVKTRSTAPSVTGKRLLSTSKERFDFYDSSKHYKIHRDN